ncbi:monosaccharide ABC transporter substrate-binding protein (CUT2 family) [Anaerobacterium chartisolvens]|uniref:Monosaccharide ABC transporter substrate-binding protein (CUT2 family) n=1 Tax=Anaerobacterium chartisolvens TaxID=1297424 RepID=A0A369B092_9FIRM|nr:substrate-binding domain-containing protein [Anaerobacterium chartisolvens]RCX14821.1 monosaccharide ABC transporter substrate-binding protein (CUT2 family) [Anaerobacterium chartisolvens]
MLRKMKGLISLALILFISALLIAGCGRNTIPTGENRKKISVIVKMKDASFFNVVRMGAEAAGKEFDVHVEFAGPDNEKDIEGQIKLVEEAVSGQYNAIVLAAGDYNKLAGAAEKAVNQNIPVIVIDSPLNSDRIKGFIGTDNVDAGSKLAETLIKRVGTECRIAVMNFMKGAASSDLREKGVFDTLNKYPDVHVVSNMYCNSDESIAFELTKKAINDNRDLDAIVCTNAQSSVGVARAIDTEKLSGKIKIIGLDSTPEEISYVEKGVIEALVIQNPFNMGYLGVRYAIDAINNKSVPKLTNTGLTIIDKDNMYLPENEKLVFPFTD